MNPPFLSLDGVDGAGKSTQCRMLAERLRAAGWQVVSCVDPGGTHVGQELRRILLDGQHEIGLACEALLFMASRAQLVAEVIRPALAAGRAVVCDRYLLANVVYQGHAGGLEPGLLWEVGRLATGGLQPDVTFVLDLPPDVAATRRKAQADRMETRGPEYFARVRQGFLIEAANDPDRITVVDAAGSAEGIHEAIVGRVAAWLPGPSRTKR